ncbi:MAG: 2-keto-4-pentenoate hydratase [Candidatus Binatia bacterium]
MNNQAAIIDALYAGRSTSTHPSGIDDVRLGLDEALTIQLGVLDRFMKAGEQLGGWKVGLTSGNARDRMGKDFRPFGYLLRSRVLSSGATAPVAKILSCSVEPELCLIVGAPLRGETVSVAEAKAAVRAVAPAFEINERRIRPEKGDALLLADGLAQWGIVVGPEAPVRDRLIDTTVELYSDGQLLETKTPGTTMDDPYLSLARLCMLLHKYGRGLEPGQPVITGSFCHHAVRQPGTYRAVFSGIGEVSVQFV